MTEAMDEHIERAAILRGVGKINGDGWKDKTKIGEVVYVWNTPLEPPYAAGQYPRVGCEIWSASVEQYDFTPAGVEDVAAIRTTLAASEARQAEQAATIARLESEATAMWRNAVTNTAALIDRTRRAHPVSSTNKAFARFDADLNDRIEKWFSFTRGAKPTTYEEAEAEWKRFTALEDQHG